MCGTGNRSLVAIWLVLAGSTTAVGSPPSLDDLSALDRPSEHFYGAIADGPAVRVAWSATPPRVHVGSEMILTLTVWNAANPRELTRPYLRSDARVTINFEVSDLESPPPDPSARIVEFRYKLTPRPHRTGSATIPVLPYKYVRLKPGGGAWKFTSLAYPIPVEILPPVKPTATGVPIEASESFFAIATNPRRLTGTPILPGRRTWLVPVALIPLAVVVWVRMWKRIYPDAARLAAIRRNRAVRRALDRLGKVARHTDPPGESASAMRDYFIERHGIPPAAQTPVEVAAAIGEAGLPADLAAKAEAYFRRCDAARFAGHAGDTGMSLAADGARLIETWEGGAA